MGAYAALVSLSHVLHQLLNPPPLTDIILHDRHQIEFLYDKVTFMIDFLESYHSRRCSKEIADLEAKIVDAAYAAEDIIETNVVDQILATVGEKRKKRKKRKRRRMKKGIERVLDMFLPVEKELMKMKSGVEDPEPEGFTTDTSSNQPLPGGKITMVGFKEQFDVIMEALAADESKRQIIPIVGMGGIGKTTLASAVYKDPFIIEHFYIRAWVTVSQEYSVRVLLLRILSETGHQYKQEKIDDDDDDDDNIGELLYKILFSRKYLIVMDDMWDIDAWDKVKRFLPDNGNGSRVLVTTRLSNLADDFGSGSPHQISLLDEERSWDLLRGEVFGKEDCPIELEELGKSIAKKCRGLPLALVVIGGILGKSKRAKEHWRSVEGDVTSTINYDSGDKQVKEILSLSYSHLPIYLKPCFLYLAVFPEDFEISVSLLIKLWVAEGLIKTTDPDKCLEEVAHEYFKNLISRNLILVNKMSRRGKVKSCKIHDLLRNFSIGQAKKENFMIYIAKLDSPNILPNIVTQRRLTFSRPIELVDVTTKKALGLELAKFNRSWLNHGRFSATEKLVNQIHSFRLLRVAHDIFYYKCHIDFSKLINLRYFLGGVASSVMSMSLCWNLQTLINVDVGIALPVEIWHMPQFRHLKMQRVTLPDPPPHDGNVIVLKNLQTLETIRNFKCTEQVLERIPNLKKLKVFFWGSCEKFESYCLKNLVGFRKLESLEINGPGTICTGMVLPISLRKLILHRCEIPWGDFSVVGSLPKLEFLSLSFDAARGEEWNPIEGEFQKLKFLTVHHSGLKIWRAENYHFPCLEHLDIRYVELNEIPTSFAEIPTLEEIVLYGVEDSVWSSVRKILEEREELGYEPLQIRNYDPQIKFHSIMGKIWGNMYNGKLHIL